MSAEYPVRATGQLYRWGIGRLLPAAAERWSTMLFQSPELVMARLAPLHFARPRVFFWRGSVWRLSEHFNCSRARVQGGERSQLKPVCLRLNGGGKAGPLPWTGAPRPNRGEKLTAQKLRAARPYILRVHLVRIAVVNPVAYCSLVTWGICRCEVPGDRT